MSTTQFISVRETAQILGISEKKVMDLIEQQQLQAYRIADKFLRLKKSEILGLRNAGQIKSDNQNIPYAKKEKVADFFYFNDFYLVCSVIFVILLYVVFYT